jgi:hypothetical protein
MRRGDAFLRSPVASGPESSSQPGCYRCCPRPEHDPTARRCSTRPGMPRPPSVAPLMLDPPRNDPPAVRCPADARPARECPARPLARPPPPAPLGRRRHGFPRSHGPPERKVKIQWLTLRCPASPSPSTVRWSGFGPARNKRGRNAKGTRVPQESARNGDHEMPGPHAPHNLCWPLCGRPSSAQPDAARKKPKEPKSRTNPREFGDEAASEPVGGGATRLARTGRHAAARTRANHPKEPESRKDPREIPTTLRPTNPMGRRGSIVRSGGREEPCQGEVSKRRATIALVRILLKCRQRAGGSTMSGVGR